MGKRSKNTEEISVYARPSRPAGSEWTSAGHSVATSSFTRAAAVLGAPLKSMFTKLASRFAGSSTCNAYNDHHQPK